ncbi:unnamed protein product [Citrullus colocynthis]|uniref:Uncharacterized protein n=1 Tax=Citrullus colocynthis TaxID=252529 RepID=A0ABP0XL25_9ROSI
MIMSQSQDRMCMSETCCAMRLWHLIFIMGHSEASTRQLWTFCSKWMKATEELLKHSPTKLPGNQEARARRNWKF